MKILHVIETMATRYGGPVGVLKSLSQAQARRGHTVSIVTTNTDYPTGVLPVVPNEPIAENGVTTTYFGVHLRSLQLSVAMAKSLPRIIASHDVVHVHGLYRFPPTFAALIARLRNKPYIIRTLNGLDPYIYARSSRSIQLKRAYEFLFDFPNLRGANAIHFTTEEERDRAAFLNLKTPSFVVPNGLDWTLFETLPKNGAFRQRIGISEDTPLVLYLGRINFKKGFDLLIPAFAKTLRQIPQARLAIVGPDNEGYGATVRDLIKHNEIADKVIFVDMLSGHEVREAFVDSDIFVLPSYTENFGMTVIEALACGTPVIISDQVNIYREVHASESGLVTTCNADKVADAMSELLQSAERASEMGKKGRAWVRETYDWSNIIEKLDTEYRAVIRQAESAVG